MQDIPKPEHVKSSIYDARNKCPPFQHELIKIVAQEAWQSWLDWLGTLFGRLFT